MSRVRARMVPRDPNEAHRASTPLELFFDLTFVAAVASAGTGLEEGLVGGDARHVLIVFPLVFFAIWWAWMNFTWFASAYDVDDVAYRLAVMVQMTGVLILAAGIIRALEQWNFDLMVVGYVVMRLGMVSLWIRAAVSDPGGRRSALRYALGISLIQVGWVASLALPLAGRAPLYGVLVVGELAVPIWPPARCPNRSLPRASSWLCWSRRRRSCIAQWTNPRGRSSSRASSSESQRPSLQWCWGGGTRFVRRSHLPTWWA